MSNVNELMIDKTTFTVSFVNIPPLVLRQLQSNETQWLNTYQPYSYPNLDNREVENRLM